MNRNIIRVAGLCAVISSIAPAPNSAAPDRNTKTLMVSVTIDSIYNHQFQVIIPVTINKHFDIGSDNGDVRNRISGVVYKPEGGKYPANLYITEKTIRGGNIGGTRSYNLELNKSVGWGIASTTASAASTRVIRLTQSSR